MKTNSFVAYLFLTFSCLLAFANEPPNKGILIVGEDSQATAPQLASDAFQEVALIYDPSELPVSGSNHLTRAKLFEAVPEQYRTFIEDFSLDDLDLFLKKKKAYLDQFSSYLMRAKIPQEKIEKISGAMETQFYHSSRLLLKVNSSSAKHKFLFRTGLSLNNEFLKKFRFGKTSLGQYLSRKKGYFYLFAGGWGLSRVVDPETKKIHLILDLEVTKEDLKAVSTLIAELVTVDLLVLGLSMDVRKGNFNSILFDKARIGQTATYLGPAGRMVRSTSQLTWELPISIPLVTSLSLPPIVSTVAFFESDVTVYRYSLNLSQLHPKEIVAKLWSLISKRPAAGVTCSAFFAR